MILRWVLVGQQLLFSGHWMSHLKQEILNVVLDGHTTRTILVIGGIILLQHYEISEDWEGKKFAGIDLE